MKKYLLFISIFCALPLLSIAQNDVYYIPSKEVNEVTVMDQQQQETEDVSYSPRPTRSTRNVDEYNRRKSSTTTEEDSYAYTDDSDLQSNVEGESDYSATKQIVRFHAPVATIVVSSPYYWDICYADTWDGYNDYWAYGLPSWSYWSYAYDPWYYNRWWYRSCWDCTWGWYDPFWGASYWGWRSPAYWGWDRPYYGGWGHGCHGDWGRYPGSYAPGFGHVAGGGRQMMANTNSITRGSAGGFVRQGGSNYRSMNNGGNGQNDNVAGGRGTLTKSFRMTGLDGRSNSTAERSGGSGFSRSGGYTRRSTSGGYSRSDGTVSNRTYSRSNQTTQSQSTNRSSNTYTPQRSTTPQQQSTPSGNYSRGGGSSTPSRSSGGFSTGRSSGGGGGGFSRGGGGGGGGRR